MSQECFTGDVVKDSQYLERFQALAASNALELVGDTILIEKLGEVESKTQSGIILPTTDISTYKDTYKDFVIQFGVVLMTGPGDVDGDGDRLKMTCKVGDVIAIPMNVHWYTQFGHMDNYKIKTIGRLRDSQVMMKFSDYNKAMEALNGTGSKV